MDIQTYTPYVSEETMMGPSCLRLLGELFERHPLRVAAGECVLDLGCGTGLTSLVIARETGARVYANDLWISEEENAERFARWGVGDRVTPVREDANQLRFEEKRFAALVSVDSYHYFAGQKGFFAEKILPFLKDGGEVLIGIPGLKREYAGRGEALLTDWLGEEAYMFRTADCWKELIGEDARIESAETWEMDCFDEAWDEWLAMDNEFARGDRQHFETIIKPYTCFVGIHVKLKEAL